MNEIWRDIEGYEDCYMVSNIGRVKSKTREANFGKSKRILKGQLMSTPPDKDGYRRLGLSKDGSKKMFSAHRLVAEAFIPNHNNKPQVNHKNGIKDDNRVENLEWVTERENTRHGYDVLGIKGQNGNQNKRVAQYDEEMNKIKEFDSMSEASEYHGVTTAAISYAVKHGSLTRKGYYWKLA